jgi:ribosomal protein L11 methyltransferase
MRHFPALDVTWATRPDDEHLEQVLAAVDDAGPLAIEDQPLGLRIFFRDDTDRVNAARAIGDLDSTAACVAIDVPDEAWAERSQAMLTAVQVGRLIITPPWDRPPTADSSAITITIQPSMGFGTGHHASTRRCLALLQRIPTDGCSVVDVGTGSGVLAIAAWRLGADPVIGIDVDPDALIAARENVDRNEAGDGVTLHRHDVTAGDSHVGQQFDIVLANLTGATLERLAAPLAGLAAPGGALIVSGFQTDEEASVVGAFAPHGCRRADRDEEASWVGVLLRRDA